MHDEDDDEDMIEAVLEMVELEHLVVVDDEIELQTQVQQVRDMQVEIEQHLLLGVQVVVDEVHQYELTHLLV